jgi:hypothetical protein
MKISYLRFKRNLWHNCKFEAILTMGNLDSHHLDEQIRGTNHDSSKRLNGLLATAQVATLKSYRTGCIQGILAIG